MQTTRRQQRRRPPRSCVECRRRKIKCDRVQPCSQCVLSTCLCLYDRRPGGKDLQRPPPANLSFPGSVTVPGGSQTGDSGLHHVGHLPAEISDLSSPLTATTTNAQGSHHHPSSRWSINDGKSHGDGNNGELRGQLGRRLRSLEELLAKYTVETAAATGTTSDLGSPHEKGYGNEGDHASPPIPEDGGQLVLNKSRLFGGTHWTNAVHEFKKITTFMRNDVRSSSETSDSTSVAATAGVQEVQALLKHCKDLSRNSKIKQSGRFLFRPEPAPSRNSADHLARLYFSRLESVFRILHGPSFWAEWKHYWADPTKSTDASILKIQLVIALGSGLSIEREASQGTRDIHQTARQWVFFAQDWLSAPFEKDRLNLDCIQIHCMLVIARQVLSIGGDLCWVSMGTLLRCAIQLGLHRDPKHFPSMSILEAEVRRRLWATILELNIQMSLDCGTPPGISLIDFDTAKPSNVNDKDLPEVSVMASMQNPESDEVTTQTSLQRLLVRSLPDRLRILQCMNGIGSPLKDEEILALSTRIKGACRACAQHCQLSRRESDEAGEKDDRDIAEFEQAMSQFLLRRFLLVLHRPLAGRIHENALHYHSRKVTFDTASALLNPVNSIESSATFSNLMVRGGGMFRSCLTHVSLALASELLIEIGDLGGGEQSQGSLAYRRLLVNSVKEARQLWAERLKRGDTNVRLHMKLSIVLGLVEMGEYGNDSRAWTQQHMTMSTKESLETCIGLIKGYHSDSWVANNLNSTVSGEIDLSDYPLDLGYDIFQTSELGEGVFGSSGLLF